MLQRLVISLIGLAAAPCIMAQGIVTYQGLRLVNATSPANSVTLMPPASITPYTITLPTSTGSFGNVLSNNGSGQLGWLSSMPVALSSITGATFSASLSNSTHQQWWSWSSLDASTTAFTLSSNSTAAASNLQTLLSANSTGSWGATANGESRAMYVSASQINAGRNVGLEIDVRSGTNNYALLATSGTTGIRAFDGLLFNPSAGLHIGPSIYASKGQLRLTSGTNTTTPQAGAWEYDGQVFYSSVAADNRGVIPSEALIVLTDDNTLTSQTAAQPLFDGANGSANGRVYLGAGTYEFECMLHLTSLATTGSFGFAFGGTATIDSQRWFTIGRKNNTGEVISDDGTGSGVMATAANTAIVTTGTGTTGYVWISGVLRVTVAGTLIPQISLGTAAAAVVKKHSYFIISPLGSSTVTTQGNWK